jgi:hypothetical protein
MLEPDRGTHARTHRHTIHTCKPQDARLEPKYKQTTYRQWHQLASWTCNCIGASTLLKTGPRWAKLDLSFSPGQDTTYLHSSLCLNFSASDSPDPIQAAISSATGIDDGHMPIQVCPALIILLIYYYIMVVHICERVLQHDLLNCMSAARTDPGH